MALVTYRPNLALSLPIPSARNRLFSIARERNWQTASLTDARLTLKATNL
jgi:hypothetical protein